jgi:hypothetical protein
MDKLRAFFLLALIYCAYIIFFRSYNKKNHCYCLNYYVMIATGILAFILLVCHKKFHACNILNIYDNNEKINLVLLIIIFVTISSIVCYLNYKLFGNKKS